MFLGQLTQASTFTYHWEIDETPEGVERATIVEPLEVKILGSDDTLKIPSFSASIQLMQKYSVLLIGDGWSPRHAALLLRTFDSVPQRHNNYYSSYEIPDIPQSVWVLDSRQIHNDIDRIAHVVFISQEAFTNAESLLAEIEGVRGRFFSKRLHHAVVRYVTENGSDRGAIDRILQERYGISVNVPNYTELTRNTTSENERSFTQFKKEELLDLISMFEEYPSNMLHTPGLKYLVRRLDGIPHPLYPNAAATAWTSAGYIEFMESAFKGVNPDSVHRLILHEKAHFLWDYLFDDQLKHDWIELGGWFKKGEKWFTKQQVEFVSAYAHGENPNEDMAESISFYIKRPGKLRSRSPAKYEFIQNRIMHGTRYISKIREDLTFRVYNLYPDYVYPGKIIRIDIRVEGAPEEDKYVEIEVEIHGESDLDGANRGYTRIISPKGTYQDIHLGPVGADGQQHHSVGTSHVLRGWISGLSRYSAKGYWIAESIMIGDRNNNERHSSQNDFGWKLYIDNPLEDDDAPKYVENSIQLSLREKRNDKEERYQVLYVECQAIEKNHVKRVSCWLNDEIPETYSRYAAGWYPENTIKHDPDTDLWTLRSHVNVPDYWQSGIYSLDRLLLTDVAGNESGLAFYKMENPPSIKIHTAFPDDVPPVLDMNNIFISAETTRPEDPNGETRVTLTFRVKDNISGYDSTGFNLRDPNGVMHIFQHNGPYHSHNGQIHRMYYPMDVDPTVYETYKKEFLLPAGSIPGIWGLADMTVYDKAENALKVDFTELVRFEVDSDVTLAPMQVSLLPNTTRLLPNYPNPFNPETWIPYQLAKETDVTLQIYSVTGASIRTLALGHQSAGIYQTRSRAAYWDGKNEQGERVASGAYFYTLKTGDFTATRKLLIRK